jgi:ferredoxin
MKKPVIDLSECVKCDICVDLCPEVFRRNDAGYFEVLDLDAYPVEDIDNIIRTCRGKCIEWHESEKAADS